MTLTAELIEKIENEELFLRVHNLSERGGISQQDATSCLWGPDAEVAEETKQDGYSCFSSVEKLLNYWEGEPDAHMVAVFSGRIIGKGQDDEPLAYPDMTVIEYVTLGELRGVFTAR